MVKTIEREKYLDEGIEIIQEDYRKGYFGVLETNSLRQKAIANRVLRLNPDHITTPNKMDHYSARQKYYIGKVVNESGSASKEELRRYMAKIDSCSQAIDELTGENKEFYNLMGQIPVTLDIASICL